MALTHLHRHPTTPDRRRAHYRDLAIIFVCVVSIALLIVGSVVEGTSPYLVAIPTLVAALTIARMGRS